MLSKFGIEFKYEISFCWFRQVFEVNHQAFTRKVEFLAHNPEFSQYWTLFCDHTWCSFKIFTIPYIKCHQGQLIIESNLRLKVKFVKIDIIIMMC